MQRSGTSRLSERRDVYRGGRDESIAVDRFHYLKTPETICFPCLTGMCVPSRVSPLHVEIVLLLSITRCLLVVPFLSFLFARSFEQLTLGRCMTSLRREISESSVAEMLCIYGRSNVRISFAQGERNTFPLCVRAIVQRCYFDLHPAIIF